MCFYVWIYEIFYGMLLVKWFSVSSWRKYDENNRNYVLFYKIYGVVENLIKMLCDKVFW